MKKIFSLICVLLAICLLTACTTVYVPQENINLNYNNLSAGDSSFWLENDYVIYSDINEDFEYNYFIKNSQGNTPISSKETSSWEVMQAYGNAIYYSVLTEEGDENYDAADVYRYDTTTKTETYLASSTYFQNFFVNNSYLYLINIQDNFNKTCYSADVISLETQETVTQISDIYTCGMRNGRFTFLKDTENGFEIFEYLPKTNESQKIGTVTLPITNDITIHETINFTNEVMILESFLTKSNASQILIYEFKSGAIKTIDTPYNLDEIIAYENNAFCILNDWEANKYFLYSLDLQTHQLLQLGKIHEDKSLFVTSDKDVYLCGWDDEIIHYNLDGTKEQVLVKEKK